MTRVPQRPVANSLLKFTGTGILPGRWGRPRLPGRHSGRESQSPRSAGRRGGGRRLRAGRRPPPGAGSQSEGSSLFKPDKEGTMFVGVRFAFRRNNGPHIKLNHESQFQ
jgi:hypothetical protein